MVWCLLDEGGASDREPVPEVSIVQQVQQLIAITSPHFIQFYGQDTESAAGILGFVCQKVQSCLFSCRSNQGQMMTNLVSWQSDESVMDDTQRLLEQLANSQVLQLKADSSSWLWQDIRKHIFSSEITGQLASCFTQEDSVLRSLPPEVLLFVFSIVLTNIADAATDCMCFVQISTCSADCGASATVSLHRIFCLIVHLGSCKALLDQPSSAFFSC